MSDPKPSTPTKTSSEISTSWLVSCDLATEHGVVGSKALNLNRLQSLGFNVPTALVIPVFDPENPLTPSLESLRQHIKNFEETLPTRIPSDSGWAVRSSATIEDLASQSLAGRFETCFIQDPEELLSAVEKVWESARLADVDERSMAVILQQLIDPDFAGVCFSKDPVSGNGQPVIEMCRGRGDQLVDGSVTPWRLQPESDGYMLPEGVSPELVNELQQGLKKLEKQFGYSVDVEWAIKEDVLYWLQVRPITTGDEHKFTIAPEQKADLEGLWVRIQHCFSPQKKLIETLNPGGYINFEQWDSRLINQFHYVQMKKALRTEVSQNDYCKILDAWDEKEKLFNKDIDERLAVKLSKLKGPQLWAELNTHIKLNRAVFKEYMSQDFLTIRDDVEKSLRRVLEVASDNSLTNEESSECDLWMTLIASNLDSTTEKKRDCLYKLANIFSQDGADELTSSQEWQDYLCLYGDESPTTHLYYLPTLRESTDSVLFMVQQLASTLGKNTEGENIDKQGQKVYSQNKNDWQQIKDEVEKKLEGKHIEEFNSALVIYRRCIKRTEDDDSVLQRATAMVRYLLLSIAEELVDQNILDNVESIFHLSSIELKELLLNKEKNGEQCLKQNYASLRDKLNRRRIDFEKFDKQNPPAMIVNGRPMNPKRKADGKTFTGTAACAGIISGTVVSVKNPFTLISEQAVNNAVVVTPLLTPSLAYGITGAVALITEAGGMASHGAIVAREMGIPAVIGIKGATDVFKTGSKVEVNGGTGEVVILD